MHRAQSISDERSSISLGWRTTENSYPPPLFFDSERPNGAISRMSALCFLTQGIEVVRVLSQPLEDTFRLNRPNEPAKA